VMCGRGGTTGLDQQRRQSEYGQSCRCEVKKLLFPAFLRAALASAEQTTAQAETRPALRRSSQEGSGQSIEGIFQQSGRNRCRDKKREAMKPERKPGDSRAQSGSRNRSQAQANGQPERRQAQQTSGQKQARCPGGKDAEVAASALLLNRTKLAA